MYCSKCGKDIQDAKFCPECGTPSPVNKNIGNTEPVSKTYTIEDAKSDAQVIKSNIRNNKKSLVLILLAIVLCFGVGIGIHSCMAGIHDVKSGLIGKWQDTETAEVYDFTDTGLVFINGEKMKYSITDQQDMREVDGREMEVGEISISNMNDTGILTYSYYVSPWELTLTGSSGSRYNFDKVE